MSKASRSLQSKNRAAFAVPLMCALGAKGYRNVIIRPAKEKDLPSILALYAQPDVDDGQVLSAEEALAIFRRFSEYPNYRLFVAEMDSKGCRHVRASSRLLRKSA